MGKGCPNCRANNWKICPNCGGYTCMSCGKNRNGEKQKSNNTCTYCRKTGSGWKVTSSGPDWGRY